MYIRIIEKSCKLSEKFHLNPTDPSHGHLFVRFNSPAYIILNNVRVEARPGDFIFYSKCDLISYGAIGPFDHDYFRFYLSDEEEAELFDFKTARLCSDPLSEDMEIVFSLMVKEFYSGNQGSEHILSMLGRLFLTYYKRMITVGDKKKRSEADAFLDLRIKLLSNPACAWTVDKLAESMHYTPAHFERRYKAAFGISPIEDVICARIKKSRELLVGTNMTVSSIASLTGYNNVEHFIRQFKKYNEGISPSAFRKGRL